MMTIDEILLWNIKNTNQQIGLEDKVVDLQKALDHVRQLQGLIPICAWYKKI